MAREHSTRRKTARKARRRFPRRRRAMVLLVVLSLLAIFTLITVSFVLLSSQHRVTATAAAKMEQRGDDPHMLLHDAMLKLIRGSTSRNVSIGAQSLLEDMYGNDAVTGTFNAVPQSVTPVPNSAVQWTTVTFDPQFVVPVPPDAQPNSPLDPFVMSTRVTRVGSFNGCVITMTTGQLAGRSSRIVEYQPNAAAFEIQFAAFHGNVQPAAGDRFVINGRPFNGTGFGLRPRQYTFTPASRGISVGQDVLGTRLMNEPLLNHVDPDPNYTGSVDLLRALLPNHSFATPEANYTGLTSNAAGVMEYDPAGPGGADEPYDAADFQNPHLAMHYWEPSINAMTTRLPSFHRPDLLNWWSHQFSQQFDSMDAASAVNAMSQATGDLQLATVMRKAMFRPYPLDHPNFPGNNPSNGTPFHPLWGYGTVADPEWDVDNDGDGKRDSIWMDFGMPAQAMPDGRWYKPMIAVLCVDMDGKLNLNAHGNANHLDIAAFQPAYAAAGAALPGPFAAATPGQVNVGEFSFGQGYGPADVNLRRVLRVDTSNPAIDTYRFLLEGRVANGQRLEGRYGEGFGEGAALNFAVPRAGFTGDTAHVADVAPYGAVANDARMTMTNLKQGQMPLSYNADAYNWPASPIVNGYGSAPDLDGDGVLLLDYRGLPYLASVSNANGHSWHGFGEPGEILNDPYEIDLTRTYGNRSRPQATGAGASPVDAPFTPEELERILRRYDADTDNLSGGSPSFTPMSQTRLTQLIDEMLRPTPLSTPGSMDRRLPSLLTTESWDLPVAGITVNVDNLKGTMSADYPVRRLQAQTMQDLLAARIRRLTPGISDVQLNAVTRDLLPPELLAGRRMDLNRIFGNGRDDNGNGVVDEPAEWDLEKIAAPDRAWNLSPKLAWFDPDNDGIDITPNTSAGNVAGTAAASSRGTSDLGDARARQLYARHLYVLMMLLVDEEFRTARGWQNANGQRQEEVAKRVAQWAINVVDFRDRDSIMTPFEYDIRPFSNDNADPNNETWNVDDNLGTNDGPHRGIVWGCERPDLLLTEVIAAHDRRTADESAGGKTSDPAPNNDADYDLIGRPRGPLVVELYNPWGADTGAAPELQGIGPNGEWGVRLNAVTPPSPATGRPSPVWRLATRQPDLRNGDEPEDLEHPEHYEPELIVADIDRVIYFTNDAEADMPTPAGTKAFNRLTAVGLGAPEPVRPGGYALIGPGGRSIPEDLDTNGTCYRVYFGMRDGSQDNAALKRNLYPYFVQLAGGPDVNANGHRVGPYRRNGNTTQYDFDLSPSVQPIVGVVIGPNLSPDGSKMLMMSISEPDDGYDITPLATTDALHRTNPNAFFPTPVDDIAQYDDQLVTDGFVASADSMVYLERLADPTQPYNPTLNPYITIDRMFVGVRSYRGEPNPTENDAKGEYGGVIVNDAGRGLDSFRRGARSDEGGLDRVARRNLWSPWTAPDETNDVTTGRLDVVAGMATEYPLEMSSFGGLNGGLTGPQGPRPTPGTVFEYGPGTYNNTAIVGAGAQPAVTPGKYNGSPTTDVANPAPPWLTWNNRPFVSPVELLLVPATSQPGLLLQHGVKEPGIGFTPYDSNNDTTEPVSAFRDSFRHLLNFFNSSRRKTSVVGGDPGNRRGDAPELYRLFDYVEVPSRFNGTEDVLDPQEFSGGDTHKLHPPYNKLFRWREPGKINLNTVYDPVVWDALTDGAYGNLTNQKWVDLLWSRQGNAYNAASYTFAFDGSTPTMFANPFRPSGSNPFVPLASLMRLKDVDTTWLREMPPGSSSNDPLFAAPTSNAPYNDTNRNPYFRYAGLQKIYNNVTTRSNVYAIWITVGYFEVTPTAISPGNPDGWQLGPEVGTDTGEIQRHRAFFLYDRTIPVGFQRGKNLNVEDGLLIQRYIE